MYLAKTIGALTLLLLASPSWASKNVIAIDCSSHPQGTIAGEISISMTNDDTVAGIQFDLLYPQVLTLSDLDGDPTTLDAVVVGTHAATLEAVASSSIDDDADGIPDRLRVLIYSLSGNTIAVGSGSIVKLYVDVAVDAESGTYPLILDDVVLASSKGAELPVTFDMQDLVIGFHDEDQDCYLVPEDCDDNDDTVYPGAPEVAYDGIDQDCSGGDLIDVDEDGYAAQEAGGDDCDDNTFTINPNAPETAYDGIDQDCSGEDLTDVDEDGHDAEVVGGADCNDDDDTVYPDAPETPYDALDQDCDGEDLVDVDEDGYDGEQVGGDDCDDEDPSIHPDAEEVPNDAIDQDCDGSDLETTTSTTTSTTQPVDSELDTGQDLSEGGDSDQACGCAAPTPLGPSALALLLLFASRRRQRDAING